MSVPALRFKQDDGRDFPDWEESKLGEISSFFSGGTPLTTNSDFYGGEIPFIKSGEISDNKTAQFITESGLKNSSAKMVLKGDLLYALYGATSGEVAISKIEGAINQAVLCIRSKLNTYFLLSYFLFEKQNILQTYLQGGQGNLSAEIIKSLVVPVPSANEQTKIANFLTTVDEKISLLTQKYDLLTQYKKGVMQKIFSQELRFKDDDGRDFPEWEDEALENLLDYEQPTKYLVSSTEYSDDYNTPVLTAGKTFILGYTNETNGICEQDLPVIIFDDFTTAFKFVPFPFKAKSSAMKILRKKAGVNISYIYSAMQLIDFPSGDEHKRYWISEYSKVTIPLPCQKEQTKIANFLTAIDDKITATQAQLHAVKQYKQGLLQQMFV